MRILACSAGSFYRNNWIAFSANKKSPSQVTASIETQKENKYIKYAGFLAGGLAVIGTGIYIYKHKSLPKNIKSIETHDLLTPLPDEKLANSLPENIREALSLNNNYEKFKQFIMNPPKQNITGSGANSVVYEIPFLDKYVLKVLNADKKTEPNRIPIGIFPPDVNLGQPVWIHPEDYKLIILNKVSGKPNSVKDWSGIIWNKELSKPVNVNLEQAVGYYQNITKISAMKQSVFDDLAMQLKVLDTTPKFEGDPIPGFKTDCINPNNLLVDFKNNKLNIIDYFGKDKPDHQNSYMDMVAVIGDFTLLPEFYDLLKPVQQKQLLNAIKIIDEKSFKAAQKVGLSTDKNVFIKFINETNKYFPIPGVKKPDGVNEYVRSYDVRAKKFVELLAGLN